MITASAAMIAPDVTGAGARRVAQCVDGQDHHDADRHVHAQMAHHDRRIDASTANRKSAQRPGDHRADGHAHTNICSGIATAATTAHISAHAADNRSGRAR